MATKIFCCVVSTEKLEPLQTHNIRKIKKALPPPPPSRFLAVSPANPRLVLSYYMHKRQLGGCS